MRILTITNLYPNPFEANRATFNREQIKALSKMAAVRVISPISWTDEVSHRMHRKPRLPRGRRTEVDGITVDYPRYYFPPKIMRGAHGWWYRWSIHTLCRAVIREFKPDILFAPWAYPDGWAAVQLGREFGLPVVIKLHGCDLLYGLSNHPSRLPGTIEAVCGADGIVSVSQDLALHATKMGVAAEDMRVIYDGVDADVFHPGSRDAARKKLGLPAEGNLILFVGSLLPVKGLDILMQASDLMQKRGVEFTLRLVGEGSWREFIAHQIDAFGLKSRVFLEGSKDHKMLADWFRAADVFVLPSRSEGVPCVLLEAIACGKPFVASRVGGIPEVAHLGNGLLVPPLNAADLSEALERQLKQAQAAAGITAVPRRGHAEAAGEILTFFDQVLQRFKPRERADGIANATHESTRVLVRENGVGR